MAPGQDMSTEGERIKFSVSVTTVTEAISTIAITPTNQTDDTIDSRNDTAVTVQRIIGVGLVRRPRERPLQDHTELLLKINKPFVLNEDTKYGVVYVQEHEARTGLFKIGHTKDMLKRAGNCKTSSAKVIYETPGGPFFAACKAKSLAGIALRCRNLIITECQRCGKGHTDWFEAPRESVLETVRTMEALVQLSAYESKNGKEWVLSAAAVEMIKNMDEFSLAGSKSSIKSTEEHPTGKTATSPVMQPSQESVTCISENSVPPSPLTSEEDLEETKTTATPEAINVGKDAKEKMSFKDTTKKIKGICMDYMESLLDRSPENTPGRR
ncbi:hypothetical protein CI238_12270 [Colletotrichum incanum]|uniref:Bacteriophage T5 Orf172 DNA-binding domain-containing protein n=1 Tax=Colletotrichum incanum TaxID=1573173 RepID=A0A167EBT2_COLIC|nr:hypothetical protein CI238_12270 [Colletotrichum incanum]